MTTLSLAMSVSGEHAVLVGGGTVAARKAALLLEAGMRLTVIAPQLVPELAEAAAQGDFVWLSRIYQPGDLTGAFLVVAATDRRAVNRQVGRDAREAGTLVNVVDAPSEGTCTFPALLRRGDLQVAVSSGGGSPAFAAAVRDELATRLDGAYAEALELISQQREKLLTLGQGHTYNTLFIKELLAGGLVHLLRQGDRAGAEALIRQRLTASAIPPDTQS